MGRNAHPFWAQDEYTYDDDVTPVGVAAGYNNDVGRGNLAINTGYFSMPVGMQAFAGNLFGLQDVYSFKFGKGAKLTLAAAYYDYDATDFEIERDANGDPILDANGRPIITSIDDLDALRLLDNNGLRDYQTWEVNAQLKFDAFNLPWTIGVDYMSNCESYSAEDELFITRLGVTPNDDTGYLAFVQTGNLSDPGDWLAAYYFSRVEALTFNGSYGQDDCVRWGSAVETRSTDLRCQELRVGYAILKNVNLVARVYIADAVANDEDGNRARIDFNFKF